MRTASLPAAVLTLTLAAGLALHDAPARGAPADEARAAGWAEVVQPFVTRYCAECHGPVDPAARLVLTDRPLADLGRDAEVWGEVIAQLREGFMPPDDASARPTALEVEALTGWLEEALARERAGAVGDPGRVTLRRLNRAEYRHTIQDLLGVAVPEGDLPDDDVGYGFDTVGDVLTTPALLIERYLEVAEQVVAAALLDLEPIQVRVEAEETDYEGRSRTLRDGFALLSTNGAYTAQVAFPARGEYVVRVRAYGHQAGPDPARLVVRLDRALATTHDVLATVDEPAVYEARVEVPAAGTRAVVAAFTNDYWQPDHPDPSQRDRNLAVDWIEVQGPTSPPPPTRAQRALVPRRPSADLDDARACAQLALTPFVARAFRRPVAPDEVERYVELVVEARRDGQSFEQGLRAALVAVLVSPHFLYKVELDPDPASAAVHPISEHELAVRLSYYLWSGPPDERLRALADAGRLRTSLEGEVQRLLDDPRASRFVEQFAGQWLQLRRLSQVSPDPERFPFDEELREAMRVESELLFEAVLREGRSALELLDAPFTFVNERLARHYGIEGVSGPRFRRVASAPERGGVLGHAGVLTVTSNPTRTSPVKRGKWVLEVLLDDPPPPPLPGMDTLPEAAPGPARTLRERLELHLSRPDCAQCHRRMDPLGFGLERFDAVGLFRETEDGLPIDASGELPSDGAASGPAAVRRFDGLPGLQRYLRTRGRDVVRALAGKLLVFALGRGPAPGDDAALDALVARTAPTWRLRDIVAGIVDTPAFQRRRGEPVGEPGGEW